MFYKMTNKIYIKNKKTKEINFTNIFRLIPLGIYFRLTKKKIEKKKV